MPSATLPDDVGASRPGSALIAFTVIALAILNSVLALWLQTYERSGAIASETARSRQLAEQMLANRNHYIETVIRPLYLPRTAAPAVDRTFDPSLIPAPMRFALDVSDFDHESGAVIKAVSPYPWARQQGRVMDAFQQQAWDTFQSDPDQVVTAQASIGGRQTLRVAISDRLTSPTCLMCHNGDPQSPKRDWSVGQVRGVMHIDRPIDGAIAAADRFSHRVVAIVSTVSLILCVLLIALARAFQRRRVLQMAAEAKIRYLAFHDPMTGLLNRVRFNERLSAALAASGTTNATVTMCLVDLDHFKAINDIYGHADGDEVIRGAAARLSALMVEGDLVARIGGDEFVFARLSAAPPDDSCGLAEVIVASMAEPFVVGDRRFQLSASVGVRECPVGGQDATTLFKTADKALYKAKELGRNRFALYDGELDRILRGREMIEAQLKSVVATGSGFDLAYQPLCDVRFGEVKGFEALMRIGTCGEFTTSAETFIPIAEELGLMPELGSHVLNRALLFAASLPDPLKIAINVSPQQFFVADPSQSIVEVTRRALAASGVPPHRVELEITEGLFLKSTDHVLRQLHGLKDLGVRLALDDFGVGYSSLGYLSRFPIDKLKIDKSFLSEAIARPVRIVPILEAITRLGNTLGLEIVAEGIETVEQAELAERVGCQQLQGFYFCRPIPECDVAAYILTNRTGTLRLKESWRFDQASFWSRSGWAETSGTWAPDVRLA